MRIRYYQISYSQKNKKAIDKQFKMCYNNIRKLRKVVVNMWIVYMCGYLVLSWVILGIIALYENGKFNWVVPLIEQIWGKYIVYLTIFVFL